MKVKLVSHASVIIQCLDLQIWTDPWLIGKVFNESWTMFPSPAFAESMLEDVNYIWISHEHPDHFNIPTLRSLPTSFKERVVILFQAKNNNKLFDAFEKIGFHHFLELPHRKILNLTSSTKVYCYQVGVMDSCLAVLSDSQVVLNVNDSTVNRRDCEFMLSDLGRVDVVLNQFSLAGYNGYKEQDKKLPFYANEILDNIYRNHHDLKAHVTIPFASFIYFSTLDNRYMNDYMNTPRDVYNRFGKNCVVLYPGDTYDLNKEYDSAKSIMRFDYEYRKIECLPYSHVKSVTLGEIKEAFVLLSNKIQERYPKIMLSWLHPVSVYIPDLNKTVHFSFYKKTVEELSSDKSVDLIINSQPLFFAFQFPFGVQTLGVSARFTILKNFSNWKYHRILFSMNNAEMYLKYKYFFRSKNLLYIRNRYRGGISQIYGKLKRMN